MLGKVPASIRPIVEADLEAASKRLHSILGDMGSGVSEFGGEERGTGGILALWRLGQRFRGQGWEYIHFAP